MYHKNAVFNTCLIVAAHVLPIQIALGQLTVACIAMQVNVAPNLLLRSLGVEQTVLMIIIAPVLVTAVHYAGLVVALRPGQCAINFSLRMETVP